MITSTWTLEPLSNWMMLAGILAPSLPTLASLAFLRYMGCIYFSDRLLIIRLKLELADTNINAKLYIRVPLWGCVEIAPLSGSFGDGINLNVNTPVATGTFGLRLEEKDVSTTVNQSVKSAGDINATVKLFTLPYVFFLRCMRLADSWSLFVDSKKILYMFCERRS